MKVIHTLAALAMAACSASALAVPVSGGWSLAIALLLYVQFIDNINLDLVDEPGKRAEIDYIYTQKENKRADASVDYIYTQ